MKEFEGTKFKDYISKEEIKGILTIVVDTYVNGADKVDGGKYTYKCELSKKKNLECIREITDHFKEV